MKNLLRLKEIYAVKMKTAENPIVTPEILEQIRKMCLSKEEEQIRLEGEFVARGGLIYPQAKERFPWWIEPFKIPAGKGSMVIAIDTHISTPHGVLWIWVDFEGHIKQFPLIDGKPNLFEVAELFVNGTMRQLKADIDLIEANLGRSHDFAYLDSSAWNTDQTRPNEKTIAEQLEEEGIYCEKGSKNLRGGIIKVRGLLEVTEEQPHPRLMAFNNLRRLRFERRNYRTPELRGRAKDERASPEKPLDKDDHLMECERRICEAVIDGKVDIIELPEAKYENIVVNGEVLDVSFGKEEEFGMKDAILGH